MAVLRYAVLFRENVDLEQLSFCVHCLLLGEKCRFGVTFSVHCMLLSCLPIQPFWLPTKGDKLYTLELSIKSPCLHPLCGSAFTPKPLFQWYPQSNEISLNSAFNAQGSRVVVHVGAVKIYAAAVEALRKKERQDETQFTTKIYGKTSLCPSYFF
jgi:hypothetical protein